MAATATPELHDAIVRLRLGGLTYRQISSQLGVSPKTISRTVISELGNRLTPKEPVNRTKRISKIAAEIINLYKTGYSLAEIAREKDTSSPTVKSILLEAGYNHFPEHTQTDEIMKMARDGALKCEIKEALGVSYVSISTAFIMNDFVGRAYSESLDEFFARTKRT